MDLTHLKCQWGWGGGAGEVGHQTAPERDTRAGEYRGTLPQARVEAGSADDFQGGTLNHLFLPAQVWVCKFRQLIQNYTWMKSFKYPRTLKISTFGLSKGGWEERHQLHLEASDTQESVC